MFKSSELVKMVTSEVGVKLAKKYFNSWFVEIKEVRRNQLGTSYMDIKLEVVVSFPKVNLNWYCQISLPKEKLELMLKEMKVIK